jgi:hypothetical protein
MNDEVTETLHGGSVLLHKAEKARLERVNTILLDRAIDVTFRSFQFRQCEI